MQGTTRRVILAVLAGGLLLSGKAYAQAVPVPSQASDLPGSAQADRVYRQQQTEDVLRVYQPETPPAIIQEKPSVPQEGPFVLSGITVEGSSVYTPADFRPFYEEYLGHPTNIEVLQYIAAKITEKYYLDGYVLSKAVLPKQDAGEGVFTIQVFEGYISDIRVDDPGELLDDDVMEVFSQFINKIKSMKPYHGPTLERLMLLMNDYAKFKASAVLEALPDAQGANNGGVGVVVIIDKKHENTTFSYNNSGSKFVGPHQVGMQMQRSLLAFDTFDLNIVTSTQSEELRYFDTAYSLPLNHDGLSAHIKADYSSVKPGYTLEEFEIKSRAVGGSVGLSYDVIRSRRQNMSVSGDFELRNSKSDLLATTLSKDQIRALRMSAHYDNFDAYDGINNVDVTISKGLDILGATKTGSLNLSRSEGRSDFTKIEAEYTRAQFLPYDLQAQVGVAGQYSAVPLLSSEEFGYGGSSFGRAYDPSELTGDKGVSAMVELQYSGLPPQRGFQITPFTFYDIGKVWNVDRLTGSRESAASAGGGVHISYGEGLSASLGAAFPLTKPVDSPIYGNDTGARWTMSLSYSF